ncbi:cytochrome P450 2B6-like isoform X1 [Stegodyphus dumicola]|uniref:cytochrome P450 2B6-like isoform X1 n=1 Tax=Stegodyphus dumicola TaxID=202533 RepID=UPI0015AB9FDF|nr:cytochrome P450 2B6-like isoform X1 [Stegodyphus dumicola]XP_035217518.1 cytochrome P450 2B6-like isoform X1 [Stegodyphus dumicola]XP_035217519.1 cytochrome P450 2B6-like isoform X1 [Stegodyphus dumicola]XP_035217520.1 cytochrome P450 2B6-like isoform X1 [Stegodyphus dumicola]
MLCDYIQNLLNASPYSVLITAIIILLTFIYYITRDWGLPPGPTGVPLLGVYPFLKEDNLRLKLEDYKKKYGDLFCFRVCGQLFINLGSLKLLREAHVSKSEYFNARFTDFSLVNTIFDGGLIFLNGESWKVLRKFFLNIFKDIGITSMKGNMAGPIYDNINSFIDDLRNRNGEPFDVMEQLNDKCMSTVRMTFLGEDGITDDELRNVIEAYSGSLDAIGGTGMLLFGKIVRYLILPFNSRCRTVISCQKRMEDIFSNVIDRHENTLDENHPRNIIDVYLKERNERKRKGDPTAEYFTKKALNGSLAQFIGDGHLAVVGFVGLISLHLMKHPEEQEKIYKEILEVIGTDRQPSIEDKSNLPYTNAFIYEALRSSDFFPFFPSLLCTMEANLRGYRIPKESITLVNFYSAHHDPECYEDPFKFDPSRYLSSAGKTRAELPVSFGTGKRSCLGEAYTMSQVFLFLTNVVQNFRLTFPEGEEYSTTAFAMKLKISAVSR